ncbi:transposase [Streptomyces canus]|uniref:transposase n=1 Tax=Streptomyces canus TaxID=58343 RepID=UPI00216B3AC1|nr:transposase [Streptomyces canus]
MCRASGRTSGTDAAGRESPDDVAHPENWRLALSLLDTLTDWQLKAPVVVADVGYGVSTPFRVGLEERGLAYVRALNGKQVAHPEDAEPHQPAYGGPSPPTLPRYRTPPRAVSALAVEAGADRFTEVTWRQGNKATRQQGNKATRQQGNKAARQQGSKAARAR